jgi:hypothetical protein
MDELKLAAMKRAAKMPIKLAALYFLLLDLMGVNGQALLDNLWPQNT